MALGWVFRSVNAANIKYIHVIYVSEKKYYNTTKFSTKDQKLTNRKNYYQGRKDVHFST